MNWNVGDPVHRVVAELMQKYGREAERHNDTNATGRRKVHLITLTNRWPKKTYVDCCGNVPVAA
jgi:hypothetical protein